MPRQPKLRKKAVGHSVYWFTKAGGETYLGNVDDVPYAEAQRLFREHLQSLGGGPGDRKGRKGLTAGELMDLFLDWIERNRSRATYTTRSIYCSRFGSMRVGRGGARIADLPADRVRSADLEAFLGKLEEDGLEPQTRLHAETSVRHCWNWATKHPSPTSYLPQSFRPFSAVERTVVPLAPLTEGDLLVRAEVEALLDCARIDPDQFRRHGLEETVARVGPDRLRRTDGFREMVACYYHTGARTGELAACRVGDFLPGTRQVVLGHHKRSRTQKNKTARHITLNDEAFDVFTRRCAGKGREDRVFVRGGDRPWTVRSLAKRFERMKQIAAVLGRPVRDRITLYDFRHLWISDAVMAGNDVLTVAKMGGTSVAMIEKVYGHLGNKHLQDAQARLDRKRREAVTPAAGA